MQVAGEWASVGTTEACTTRRRASARALHPVPILLSSFVPVPPDPRLDSPYGCAMASASASHIGTASSNTNSVSVLSHALPDCYHLQRVRASVVAGALRPN